MKTSYTSAFEVRIILFILNFIAVIAFSAGPFTNVVTVTWNGTHKYKLNLVFLIWSDKNVSKLLNANAANLFVYLTLGEKLCHNLFLTF